MGQITIHIANSVARLGRLAQGEEIVLFNHPEITSVQTPVTFGRDYRLKREVIFRRSLIGRQGTAQISVDEVTQRLRTNTYDVVSRILSRYISNIRSA